jgi:hypothetical protein
VGCVDDCVREKQERLFTGSGDASHYAAAGISMRSRNGAERRSLSPPLQPEDRATYVWSQPHRSRVPGRYGRVLATSAAGQASGPWMMRWISQLAS